MFKNPVILFLIGFIAGEIVAAIIFYFIRKQLANSDKGTNRSVFKGILERFVLLLGLFAGITTILIFFGVVKLGTRLKESQDSAISNDCFLIGNISSLL